MSAISAEVVTSGESLRGWMPGVVDWAVVCSLAAAVGPMSVSTDSG